MKYAGSLYVTQDAERTKAFYSDLLGLRVIQDFGANFTLTGGLSFQTLESWSKFIKKEETEVILGHHDGEIYFETEDLDSFLKKLNEYSGIELIHPLQQQEWGQKVIRFYDPDHHVLEVAEPLKRTVKRLHEQGMTTEAISKKTMLSQCMIERMLKGIQ